MNSSALLSITVSVLLCGILGCNVDSGKHAKAVAHGREHIAQVKEMEQLFGRPACFITHFGIDEPPLLWNSVAVLYNRYRLSMEVLITLNHSMTEVTGIVGEPKFYLHEITQVDDDRVEHIGAKLQFGTREWNRVVEAEGDFSVIGFTVHKDRPVEGVR